MSQRYVVHHAIFCANPSSRYFHISLYNSKLWPACHHQGHNGVILWGPWVEIIAAIHQIDNDIVHSSPKWCTDQSWNILHSEAKNPFRLLEPPGFWQDYKTWQDYHINWYRPHKKISLHDAYRKYTAPYSSHTSVTTSMCRYTNPRRWQNKLAGLLFGVMGMRLPVRLCCLVTLSSNFCFCSCFLVGHPHWRVAAQSALKGLKNLVECFFVCDLWSVGLAVHTCPFWRPGLFAWRGP